MDDEARIRLTLICRDHGILELADFPAVGGGNRALLVFCDPERAENFRSATGAYPDSEGFEVWNVSQEKLREAVEATSYQNVALLGRSQGPSRSLSPANFSLSSSNVTSSPGQGPTELRLVPFPCLPQPVFGSVQLPANPLDYLVVGMRPS
jgi:hypothetical protein